MTTQQLFRLFIAIAHILPVSFVLLKKHKEEFVSLFKILGKFLAEWIEKRGGGNQGIDDLAEASANRRTHFICNFFGSWWKLCQQKTCFKHI